MKIFHYTTLALSLSLLTISCNKDFLDRSNKTAVTDQNFFKTPEDLKTYTNGFYRFIGGSYDDIFSDNIGGFTGSSSTNNMLRGTLTQGNASGWSDEWKNLRRINYMMDHLGTVTGDQAQIDHYVGIARFFRAYIYFNLVRDYNNVPWYDTALGAEDEAMYKDQDSREVVVKHIMEDLEFAAAHIREDKVAGNFKERVTQGAALTLLARIALHEGTFRKYHEELNLQASADEFLKRAASASQEVINSGKYKIHNTGAKEVDFRTLFSSNNLSSNTEAIFIQKNDRSLGIANNSHTVLDWQWALSGELMEEFLTADGKSFTSTPDYKTKTFTQIFQNRDPRLAETIMPAGFKTDPNNPTAYLIKPSFGGYLQIKFYPRDPALRGGWDANYTDLPIMRYAEVLLINAEAKAELGTLTQADLDATVNVLRGRVGVPALLLATANTQVDPVLAARYPNAQGANKGALL
ncbi:MAG: RagB/SusD family nutrient uptake outer membrane protein, partial [Sphingobacterium paramultivorum]